MKYLYKKEKGEMSVLNRKFFNDNIPIIVEMKKTILVIHNLDCCGFSLQHWKYDRLSGNFGPITVELAMKNRQIWRVLTSLAVFQVFLQQKKVTINRAFHMTFFFHVVTQVYFDDMKGTPNMCNDVEWLNFIERHSITVYNLKVHNGYYGAKVNL